MNLHFESSFIGCMNHTHNYLLTLSNDVGEKHHFAFTTDKSVDKFELQNDFLETVFCDYNVVQQGFTSLFDMLSPNITLKEVEAMYLDSCRVVEKMKSLFSEEFFHTYNC